MKKWFVSALILSMVMSFTACGQKPKEPQKDPVAQEQDKTQDGEKEPEKAPEAPAEQVELTLYLPNDDANGFETEAVQVEKVDAETIVAQLIDKGVLPAETVVNQFEKTEAQLNVDFNQAFLEKLNGTGTSGEYMMMGSVVNTFLNAFDAKQIAVTVDGEIPETGHSIYDAPQAWYE